MDATAILVAIIIAVAFFGQSIFGFGGGLAAVPLLSLLLGVKDAVTLVLIFQLIIGLLLWKSYKDIDWKSAKSMTPSLLLGSIAGTLLLSITNVMFLQLFLAATIIAFLIKMVWFEGFTFGSKSSAWAATAAGLSGGLIGGLTGTPGPPLIMYLTVAIRQTASFRATLMYLFFISSIVRLVISAPGNLYSTYVLHLTLISLPLFLLAIFVGQHIHNKVHDKYYRLAIFVVLGGSAIVLIAKAL